MQCLPRRPHFFNCILRNLELFVQGEIIDYQQLEMIWTTWDEPGTPARGLFGALPIDSEPSGPWHAELMMGRTPPPSATIFERWSERAVKNITEWSEKSLTLTAIHLRGDDQFLNDTSRLTRYSVTDWDHLDAVPPFASVPDIRQAVPYSSC